MNIIITDNIINGQWWNINVWRPMKYEILLLLLLLKAMIEWRLCGYY